MSLFARPPYQVTKHRSRIAALAVACVTALTGSLLIGASPSPSAQAAELCGSVSDYVPTRALAQSTLSSAAVKAALGGSASWDGHGSFIVNSDRPSSDFTHHAFSSQAGLTGESVNAKGQLHAGFAVIDAATMAGARSDSHTINPAGYRQLHLSGDHFGDYLYNRGHLVGAQFIEEAGLKEQGFSRYPIYSEANPLNIATQTAWANKADGGQQGYGQEYYENQLATYVRQEKVDYEVKPIYAGSDQVPIGNQLEARNAAGTHTAYSLNVFIPNVQPGISISYASGAATTKCQLSTTTASSSVKASVPIYRLYNPNSGEHFYTSNLSEMTSLVHVGWNYEGIGWVSPSAGSPVYRLYNPNALGGDHYYTTSLGEKNSLVASGWRYDGSFWKSGGTVKVLVAYNPNAQSGAHNFTVNGSEQANLLSAGWKYPGVAWRAAAITASASVTKAAQAAANAAKPKPAPRPNPAPAPVPAPIPSPTPKPTPKPTPPPAPTSRTVYYVVGSKVYWYSRSELLAHGANPANIRTMTEAQAIKAGMHHSKTE